MLLLLLGCAHSVDITLTAADLAPTMANAAPWDGPQGVLGVLDEKGKASLAAALGSVVGNAAVGEAVAGVASSLQQPDAGGELSFTSADGEPAVTVVVPTASDSLAPRWVPGLATLKAVSLRPKSKLRVLLVDKDIDSDDPIGSVVLTSAQLAAALGTDGAFTVDTSRQSSGQLLSVSILVVPAPK